MKLLIAAALGAILAWGGSALHAAYTPPPPYQGVMQQIGGTWQAGWTHVSPVYHEGIMDVFVYNTNNGKWGMVRLSEPNNCDPMDLANCHP